VTEGQFTEADLAPSDDERRAARKFQVERGATGAAVLAIGLWIGGLVALGACAAPFVFQRTPAPYSGDAMGAAFARFDSITLGCAVVLLGAEATRTWASGKRGRTTVARVRRVLGVVLAAAAAYVAMACTPQIQALHAAGVRRNDGPQGVELERIHKTAELVGKLELAGGAALIFLHVFTLGAKKPDDDDDDLRAPEPGPLPPGRL
jgi:hypothetical protein